MNSFPNTMDLDIRVTLDDIFQTVCDLPPDKRSAYLNEACAGDESMRREVEELIRYYETNKTFLEKPAIQDVAQELVESGSVLPPPCAQPMIGKQIGNYRILAMIGKGGMGEVYLAHDNDFDVDVAIKFLPEAYANDPEWQARFNREGRLNAELAHQNIAALRHKGVADGRPFLVFEYVPGETLEDKLDKGTLAIKEAMPIFSQLAAALAHAHANNIIHRDLKPANIKITPDGQLKVLDFGIAKRITTDLATVDLGAIDLDDQLTRGFGETRQGEVIGTVAYMSPEQTRGQMLDAGTDLWSFGVVMYQALTGKLPFKGVDTYDTLNLIRDQKHEPDLHALPAATPKPIQRLLRRCFVKERERRASSAAEVLETIERLSNPVAKLWKRVAAAVTALLAITIALVWLLWPAPPPAPKTYLAVLPFGEAGEQRLRVGDGLAKSLRDLLATIPNLSVLPYSGSGELNVRNTAPDVLMKATGVSWLLSGDVEHQGDNVQVRFRIYGSRLQQPIEGAVKGSRNDYFQLGTDLSNSIARALNLPMPNAAARAKPTNQSLEEQYLAAETFLQEGATQKAVDEAIKLLEPALKADPDSVRAHTLASWAYYHKAQFTGEQEWVNKALKASEQAIGLDPNSHEVKVTRGMALTYLERNSEAIETLKQALESRPDDVAAAFQLAAVYAEDKQWEEAKQIYLQAITAWPSYWRGHNEFGVFLLQRRDYAKALTEFQQALAGNPHRLDVLVNSGHAHLGVGNYVQAEQTYRQAMEVQQQDTSQEEIADLWSNIGAAQFQQQHYPEAAESFKKAVASKSNNALFLGNLGDASRYVDGEEKTAYDAYSAAIKLRLGVRLSDVGKARLAELYAKRSILPVTDAGQAASDRQHALSIIQQVADADLPVDQVNLTVFESAIKVYALLTDGAQAAKFVEKSLRAGLSLRALEDDPDLQLLRQTPEYHKAVERSRQQQ